MDIEQRQILINQYEILKCLTDNEHLRHEYDRKIEILTNGYKVFYDNIFMGLCDELPNEIAEEVYSILDLFRVIHNSLKDLKIDDDNSVYRFEGFDSNFESSHYWFCKFLLEDGLYKESYLQNLDSGCRRLNKYRKMLNKWHELGNNDSLTLEQIKNIVL